MPISRRQFIKRSAAAVTVGVVVPQWLAGVARGQQIELAGNRRFVIIQLAGGNDGLPRSIASGVRQGEWLAGSVRR